ncbi:efflux RND transporter permease subunit [Patescibacteria group bacterium]
MGRNLNKPARITRRFVLNPALSWLLFFVAVVGGVFGYLATPKTFNPEVDIASFTIISQYPGATAEEVEQFLTKELEQVLADLDGIDKISSVSVDGGAAMINLVFEVGVDVTEAKTNVLSKINSKADLFSKYKLPQPVIKSNSYDNLAVATFGFTSDTLSQNQIRELVVDIRERMREVPNTANQEIFGGQSRAIRILLDPQKLKLRNVSAVDVMNAVEASNIKFPVGSVRNGETVTDIEVVGTLMSAEEAKQIIVAPYITLEDVAEIDDSFSEPVSSVKVYQNGEFEDAIFLTVGKIEGSNIVVVVQNVIRALEKELEKEKYDELNYQILRDEGEIANNSTFKLLRNLMMSIGIVFLVLIIFLQFRPALNVAIAIPLSLAITFFVGYLSGETINKVSMFAFILSLGLLVDAATVVVENSYRHIQLGEPKLKAIIKAVHEVGIGLFMSTLTSVIVFLPINNVKGTIGEYVEPMAFFVPVALIASFVLALTVTPFLASQILEYNGDEGRPYKSFFEKIIDKLTNLYEKLLVGLLAKKSRQILFIIVLILALGGSIAMRQFDFVKQRSLPDANLKQLYVYLDAPYGTDVNKTYEIVEDVVELAGNDADINSMQIYTGTPPVLDVGGTVRSAAFRNKTHQATIKVNLVDQADRDRNSSEIVRSLRDLFASDRVIQSYVNSGTNVRVLEDPPGPPTEAAMVAKIKGPDREIRQQVALDLEEIATGIEGAVDIETTVENAYRKILYKIDHEKALASGVTAYAIAQSMQAALGPLVVDQYHLEDRAEFALIEVQYDKDDRSDLEDLSQIYVKNFYGEMVPIDSVVEKVETRNEPVRYRDGRQPVAKVTAHMHDRSIPYAMRDLENILENEYEFPNGGELVGMDKYGFDYELSNGDEYRIEWGGEWEQSLNVNAELFEAMVIAFLIVYALLVFQFSSFTIPLIIMSTIPLGFIGVFPGFALLWVINGTYMSSTALIGFIALIGIVVNNSIMFIEMFDILREKGMKMKDALILAGRTRLRPIMLTSLTTIFGTLAIAFDPTWAGLAWSIIFGLGLSAGIAVFLIPTLYNLIRPRRGLASEELENF